MIQAIQKMQLKYKENDYVKVVGVIADQGIDSPCVEEFIDARAKIVCVNESCEYPYTLEFDDEKLERKGFKHWAEIEISPVEI